MVRAYSAAIHGRVDESELPVLTVLPVSFVAAGSRVRLSIVIAPLSRDGRRTHFSSVGGSEQVTYTGRFGFLIAALLFGIRSRSTDRGRLALRSKDRPTKVAVAPSADIMPPRRSLSARSAAGLKYCMSRPA